MKSSAAVHPDENALRAFALTFPGAHEDHPWGESAFKVKGKVFLFVYVHAQGLNASMKLPTSNERALAQPFAEPTGYGLGKSGWVTCKFDAFERVPLEAMKAWIVESYRAVAPKKLVAAFDAGSTNADAATRSTAGVTKAPARAPTTSAGTRRRASVKPASESTSAPHSAPKSARRSAPRSAQSSAQEHAQRTRKGGQEFASRSPARSASKRGPSKPGSRKAT